MIKIFVGSLAWETTPYDLHKASCEIVPKVKIKIKQDRETGRCRGFGFIGTMDDTSAQLFIQKFHEKEFKKRTMFANIAKPREDRSSNDRGSDYRETNDDEDWDKIEGVKYDDEGWGEKVEDNEPNPVYLIFKEAINKIINIIANDKKHLFDIEWRELERVIHQVFEEFGFESELTNGSKDGGKDVILRCKVNNEEHTYFIEIKHWCSGKRVGVGVIKDFLNVIINEKVNGGLFLSTSGFSKNSCETLTSIERQSLKFGGENKIVTLCNQ